MSDKVELQRYNVYSCGEIVLDFVIATEHIAERLDSYWEASMENVIEAVSESHGVDDPVAIHSETFLASITDDDLTRDGVEVVLYYPVPPPPVPAVHYAH